MKEYILDLSPRPLHRRGSLCADLAETDNYPSLHPSPVERGRGRGQFNLLQVVCFSFFMLCALPLCAQQSQPITQYLFSRFLLNPASCGANGYTSVGLTFKDQWTGFGHSPTNQVLFGQYRMRPNRYTDRNPERIGLGAAVFNDIRGPLRTTGAQFTYAYHIEDHFGQLSFGLTGSFFQFYADREKMVTENYDQYLMSISLSKIVPDALFGVHYTTPEYYAGLSISNLFQSFLTFGGRNSANYRIERQYLLMGGYVFDLDRKWTLVPALQTKFTERFAAQIDINVLAYWYDQFWGGFSYRSGGGGAIGGTSLIFGTRYNQFYFGYAFDYSISKMGRYSFGSHELMLSISFGQYDHFFRYNRRYEFQNIRDTRRRVYN